jgi:hypothetical protein
MAKTGQKGPTETKEDKHWSAYKQGLAGARRGLEGLRMAKKKDIKDSHF